MSTAAISLGAAVHMVATPEIAQNLLGVIAELPRAQSSRVENDPLAGLENGVSPEAIMNLLQIRMRDFDSEIGTRLGEIRTHQADSKRLSDKLSTLNQFQTNFVDAGGNISPASTITPTPDQYQRVIGEIDVALSTALNPSAERTALEAAKGAFECPGTPPPTISFAVFKALHPDALRNIPTSGKASDSLGHRISEVKDQLQTLNTGNDLRMTQLQSTLQQRTALIQMGSNLLKSLDEASRAIINNMR